MTEKRAGNRWRKLALLTLTLLLSAGSVSAQAPSPTPPDPASEPTVLAVAKVLPAVVNINTERVVRRQVRDPWDDFAAQFFGVYRNRPREIRQTLQSLGSGFLVDPSGYIVTNEHVVSRAADLKIEVIRWAPVGDAVMVEWRAHATVQGKAISWTGVDRFNVRDGRMYEASVYWDTRGLAERFAALTGQSQ